MERGRVMMERRTLDGIICAFLRGVFFREGDKVFSRGLPVVKIEHSFNAVAKRSRHPHADQFDVEWIIDQLLVLLKLDRSQLEELAQKRPEFTPTSKLKEVADWLESVVCRPCGRDVPPPT